MIQMKSRIVGKTVLTKEYIRLSFEWSGEGGLEPGQFFTLKCSEGSDPLLRRPFAFSGFSAGSRKADFIFQVRGRATSYLSSLSEGAALDVLGPLGKGFSKPSPDAMAVVAAGGIGLGPMLFLARTFEDEGIDTVFIFGTRNANLMPKDLEWPKTTVFCTDDGSSGFMGTPVSWMEQEGLPVNAAIFACGPYPFLKATALFARARGLACQVAVEQTMACGVGACMGCAVKLSGNSGYARACADGPVFAAEDLSWE
jgi:dihydroorotate dehydrogenase electron transfer subunit